MIKRKSLIVLLLSLVFMLVSVSVSAVYLGRVECEDMDIGGQFGSVYRDLFDGVALYTNGDYAENYFTFPNNDYEYTINLRGVSSSSSSPASVAVFVDGTRVGAVTFSSTTPSTQSIQFRLRTGPGSLEVRLVRINDDGSSNAFVDYYEVYEDGEFFIPDPPTLPRRGAYETGEYRNLFKELGKSEAEINAKINEAFEQLFYGDDEDERIYYPVGSDMAYILDVNNNDVRSEGMSYGMMIAVQMDKQEEFDRIWNWARTYMHHESGEYEGYFAWQVATSGNIMDNTPAPDGEIYFATALFLASHRWGDGTGIYNYKQEAQDILDAMLHQEDNGVGVNMFNRDEKMVVFCPIGQAATFTDPSYHMPAFYELWARWADKNNDFWYEAAEVSREFFKDATHPETGLAPDYSEFDGTPTGGTHREFRFDAWRVAQNIAMDYAWWVKDDWAVTFADRIQTFFYNEGIGGYANQYTLDGQALSSDHSTGLIAMNAVSGLASTTSMTWEFVEALWNAPIPTGRYRYYDGALYMLGLLHASGNYKIYDPDNIIEPVQKGDINGDGVIDSRDVLLLQRYVIGQIDNIPYEAADLNNDNTINALDITLLQRYVLGIIDSF
ncbi:glycosyl hydrolase family 8 [Natronospora cellulosivora (SeqCode)]